VAKVNLPKYGKPAPSPVVMPNVGQSATLFLCLKEKAFYYPDSQA